MERIKKPMKISRAGIYKKKKIAVLLNGLIKFRGNIKQAINDNATYFFDNDIINSAVLKYQKYYSSTGHKRIKIIPKRLEDNP